MNDMKRKIQNISIGKRLMYGFLGILSIFLITSAINIIGVGKIVDCILVSFMRDHIIIVCTMFYIAGNKFSVKCT